MQWQRMTLDEYALYQQANGVHTSKTDGVWWAEVKPCFYRPLLPWTVVKPGSVNYPPKYHIGGIQHAIPQEIPGNSYINLFFLNDLQNYSLESLCHKRRNQVKKGLNHFTSKQITDSREFKEQAFQIYVDFYHRTHYGYKKDRLHRDHFNAWADTLFANPKILILGAYHQDKLSAVNTSYQVEDTIIGSSFFADTTSLSLGISDFFMHTIREIAASSDAASIFYGWATGEKGLDDFKLIRGCELEKLPARYQINPFIHYTAKLLIKNKYLKLCGCF
ncbi:MAG TPA: hypothetical protein PLP19_16265 [bacterium]|nr:hypothetical protein [bacterium]HPN45047.1 hypothetical protein [bacterium]